MTVLHRLAAFAVAAAVLAPLAAKALDANSDTYNTAAFSGMPTFIHLCDGDAAILSGNACKDGSYAQQAKALESALQDALEKAPANVRPLLKRDQYWFGETLQNAAGNANLESKNPADREPFERMLSQRIVTLAQMTNGFPRAGVLGKWENAFGSVTVAAADDGAYRLAIITDSGFGPENTPDEHRHWHCEATALARDDLNKLQRERIALLEGFDENRKGLAGLWLSYTAVLKVEATDDGGIEANGWKWEPQDYKGGCDYVISGKVVGGTFRSDDKRKNPDTLERDHATLIVNRLDDAFARKRFDADDPDEQKYKRSPGRSSTVRLFPVRPSPDIDEKGDWH